MKAFGLLLFTGNEMERKWFCVSVLGEEGSRYKLFELGVRRVLLVWVCWWQRGG